MKTVAFIGAGQMGGRLASRVQAAGYPLLIYDPALPVREAFQAMGAKVVDEPAQCGSADIVIFFVKDGPQALEATFGHRGLASGLDSARPPLVVMMSTVMPAEVRAIAERLAPAGVRVVDAPVAGGLTLAEQGKLTLLLDGSTEDLDEVEPLLRVMGEHLLRCGTLGAAQAVKIINNMSCVTSCFVTLEAYRLALSFGIDSDTLAPLLDKGTGRNFWTRDAQDAVAQYDAFSRDSSYFETFRNLCLKDWRLALKLADEQDVSLPFFGGLVESLDRIEVDALRAQMREMVDAARS